MHSIARIACLTLALALPAQAQETQGQSQEQSQGPSQAQPQERVEIDTNLMCDTPQQVERFLTLLDEKSGSAEAAIEAVNDEAKTVDACVIATAAYRRAGGVATVSNSEATFDVTRIIVIGVYTVNGLEQSTPTEFYTLIPRRDEDVTVGRGR